MERFYMVHKRLPRRKAKKATNGIGSFFILNNHLFL